MKIIHIIKKSAKEQLRSFWMLLLTLSMGPFFIFVYFLIAQSSERNYNVLIENKDTGVVVAYEPKPNKINANHEFHRVNHGANLIVYTNKELIKNGYEYINCNQVTSSDMFTASIAFIWEVENKTITLLKLSNLNPIEYLLGVSSVQTIIGVVAAFLSLGTAIALGFSVGGSVDSMYVGGTQNNISIIVTIFIVSALTSLSIVAFSLIVAACTKSANEILIVGCFPMFLFMFFSGAAFPLNTSPLFSIAGYPLSIQSLMSPTHATSALNKILVMDQSLTNIIPELISISILTIIYLIIGAILFKKRHYGLLSHARKS